MAAEAGAWRYAAFASVFALLTIAGRNAGLLILILAGLAIIAAIAPMMGFIGTISGVIKIFYTISVEKVISIDGIAGGLYEKMITSAAGLAVGIFAYVCFNLLNNMIDRVSYMLEANAVDFIDLIQEPSA